MSILADILDDNCTSLDDWSSGHYVDGSVTVDDGFKLDVTGGIGSMAAVWRSIGSFPNETTCQIITNFPTLGTGKSFLFLGDDTLAFMPAFSSDGLTIFDGLGYGSHITLIPDVVKYNTAATDQTWRFEINKTTSLVTAYLDGDLLGTFNGVMSIGGSGIIVYFQSFLTTVSHIKEVKIGTGLGEFIDDPKVRYWIGNSGSWDDTNHWSLTSGGVGGASVPTVSDDVVIDNNSFTEPGQYIEFPES